MTATWGDARASRATHCRPLVTVVWYRTHLYLVMRRLLAQVKTKLGAVRSGLRNL